MVVSKPEILQSASINSFLEALEFSLSSLVITDADMSPDGQKFIYVNERFKQQTQYSEQELLNKTPRILQGVGTSPETIKQLKTALLKGETFVGQTVNYRKDGSSYPVRWSINPIRNEQHEIIAFLSNQLEITEFVKAQDQALFLAEALNQSADGALITDLQGNIIYANRAFSRLTGYSFAEIEHQNVRMFKSGKMSAEFYDDMWSKLSKNQPFEGVFLNVHKNGKLFFEQKTITTILDHDNQSCYYLALSKDSSEVINKTNHLEYQAYHDPLTGLFNRAKFDEIMDYKMRVFETHHAPFCIILSDIDNFKMINDTLGHAVGDEALQQVAHVLHSNLRDADVVVRWGGEEFCILVDATIDKALTVAELLRLRINTSEFSMLPSKTLSMSFGVAQIYPQQTPEELFVKADQAVYLAKKLGKNRVCRAD